MKAFNIHLSSKNDLALTILFADEQYKIIYDGGIIGALSFQGNTHQFIKAEDVVPGQLPLYDYKKTNENTPIEPLELRQNEIEEIATHILETKM